MELQLNRLRHTEKLTQGELYQDGRFFCYTCEDAVREIDGVPVEQWKIPAQTAIPKGRYKVIITFSNRFQKHLPLLLDVPGFKGIRIHAGNTEKDTEGCVLLGLTQVETGVANSRAAMAKFMAVLQAAIDRGENVYITVG